MPDSICYRSFGKINLYLDVLDRRDDGYNNIETIFQSVGMSDFLTFTPAAQITCTCDDPRVPVDETNLAVKAARLASSMAGRDLGVRIDIEKRLPVAGGMAGGSGNAAATLLALNEMFDMKLDDDTLQRLALQLGSDVPFCLKGGTMAATGRGEIFYPMPALPETWLVLVLPGIPISAGVLYNHPQLERSLEVPQRDITPLFARALTACSAGNLRQVIFNRLEGPAFLDYPELLLAKEALIEAGCVAAAMSGSGSALFGVCESREQAENLATLPLGLEAVAVPTVSRALERLEETA